MVFHPFPRISTKSLYIAIRVPSFITTFEFPVLIFTELKPDSTAAIPDCVLDRLALLQVQDSAGTLGEFDDLDRCLKLRFLGNGVRQSSSRNWQYEPRQTTRNGCRLELRIRKKAL